MPCGRSRSERVGGVWDPFPLRWAARPPAGWSPAKAASNRPPASWCQGPNRSQPRPARVREAIRNDGRVARATLIDDLTTMIMEEVERQQGAGPPAE